MDPEESISRPLSRGSVTSGVSMMATKDGVDGEKVKRLGIPQYSLNLLNSMAHNQYKKMHHLGTHGYSSPWKNQQDSVSLSSLQMKSTPYLNTPNGPPMTLREKMHWLSSDINPDMEDNINDHSDFESAPDSLSATPSDAQNAGGYTTKRKFQNAMQDGNPPNFFQTASHRSANGSDIESNVSTVGDEASFSRNIQNLSPPISVAEGKRE